jgi:hypothetical protein
MLIILTFLSGVLMVWRDIAGPFTLVVQLRFFEAVQFGTFD